MKKSQVVQLLEALSTSDLRRLKAFIYSPYFNKNKKVQQLLELLLDTAPDFAEKRLAKPVLLKKLFDNSTNDLQKLKDIASELMQVIERFFAQQHWEQSQTNIYVSSSQAALQANILPFFEKENRKSRKLLAQQTWRDAAYFMMQYQSEALAEQYNALLGKRTAISHLQAKMDYLDLAYLLQKLKCCCDLLSHQLVMNSQSNLRLLAEIEEGIVNNQDYFEDFPSIQIYHQTLLMLKEPEEEKHYQLLVPLLEKWVHLFPREEARELYTYARNYCIWQSNRGKKAYETHLFGLFQQLIRQNLLLEKEQLSQWTYLNIIVVGCRLSEFDWTRKFIFDYKNNIVEGQRANAFNYNLAYFHYQKGELQTALSALRDVEFTDVYYQLNARILLLKTNFELADWQALDYTLDSFRIYLLRNKAIPTKRKKSAMNLVRFTQKLVKIKEFHFQKTKQQTQLEDLRNAVEAQIDMLQRDWLLGQI